MVRDESLNPSVSGAFKFEGFAEQMPMRIARCQPASEPRIAYRYSEIPGFSEIGMVLSPFAL